MNPVWIHCDYRISLGPDPGPSWWLLQDIKIIQRIADYGLPGSLSTELIIVEEQRLVAEPPERGHFLELLVLRIHFLDVCQPTSAFQIPISLTRPRVLDNTQAKNEEKILCKNDLK